MAVNYQPRHAAASAKLEATPGYVGRHRDDRCTCNATGVVHEPDCRLLGDIVQRLDSSAGAS